MALKIERHLLSLAQKLSKNESRNSTALPYLRFSKNTRKIKGNYFYFKLKEFRNSVYRQKKFVSYAILFESYLKFYDFLN